MHQNLLPNNNDAQSTTKDGFLLRPDAQIVALRAHCARTARALRLRRPPIGGKEGVSPPNRTTSKLQLCMHSTGTVNHIEA